MSPHTLQKPLATAGLMPGRLSYLVQENPLVHPHLTGWVRRGGIFAPILAQIKGVKHSRQNYDLVFKEKQAYIFQMTYFVTFLYMYTEFPLQTGSLAAVNAYPLATHTHTHTESQ